VIIVLVLQFGTIKDHTSGATTATIIVDTTDDVVDAVDGGCSAITVGDLPRGGDKLVSLREALCAANYSAGDDTIILPAGTFSLTRVGENENFNDTGDLDILNSQFY